MALKTRRLENDNLWEGLDKSKDSEIILVPIKHFEVCGCKMIKCENVQGYGIAEIIMMFTKPQGSDD